MGYAEPTEEVKQVNTKDWDAKAIGASIAFCLKEIGCPHVIRITKDNVTIDLPTAKDYVIFLVEPSEDPDYCLQYARKYDFQEASDSVDENLCAEIADIVGYCAMEWLRNAAFMQGLAAEGFNGQSPFIPDYTIAEPALIGV